jgi:hypothetical protein
MSPENQGVFQLIKEVTFCEFWYFKMNENGAILRASICKTVLSLGRLVGQIL